MSNPQFRQIAYWRLVVLTTAIMALLMSTIPMQFQMHLPVSTLVHAANTTVDLSTANAVDLSILGAKTGDMAGSSIAIGDVNGDKIDDLVIGIPGSDGASGKVNSGEVDIFFGRSTLRGSFDLASTAPDVRIFGANNFDFLGSNVGFFDINADNVKDLILAAPGADGINNSRDDAGELYVFFGGKSLPSTSIDLATTKPDVLIVGPRIGSQIGASLAGGNVVGNGNQDLVIGSPLAPRDSDGVTTGAVYILSGSNFAPPFVLDLNSMTALTLSGVGDAGERFGTSVAVGDVNNDNIPDLIVGAPSGLGGSKQASAGFVKVFYGPLTNTSTNFSIFGPNAQARLGESVAIGDIDGDRIGDIIVTAPGATANGRTNAGESFIFYGSAPLTASRDLATGSADASVAGANSGDQLGGTININTGTANQITSSPSLLVSDIDRDGFADLVIGAPVATNPASRARNGEAFVLLKGGNRFEQRDLQTKPADITILGPRAVEQVATRFTIGDINNDGKPDLVISAPQSGGPNNRANAGMVYVISNFNLGSATNNNPPTINPVPAQTVSEGNTLTVNVSAIDPDSAITLSLDRPPTPSFVTLQDSGNGQGTLTITPPVGSMGSYVITLRATDNGSPPLATAVDIALTVTPPPPPMPMIDNVVFNGKSITITGSLFGAGVHVLINGTDESKRIKSSSDTSIFLKGKAKKLGLRTGGNTVQAVDSSGRTSNIFTLNVLSVDSQE